MPCSNLTPSNIERLEEEKASNPVVVEANREAQRPGPTITRDVHRRSLKIEPRDRYLTRSEWVLREAFHGFRPVVQPKPPHQVVLCVSFGTKKKRTEIY